MRKRKRRRARRAKNPKPPSKPSQHVKSQLPGYEIDILAELASLDNKSAYGEDEPSDGDEDSSDGEDELSDGEDDLSDGEEGASDGEDDSSNETDDAAAGGQLAARFSDHHNCPEFTGTIAHVGGPVTEGSTDTYVQAEQAARVGDRLACKAGVDAIATGSPTVYINGRPAARVTDTTDHGGVVASGASTVHFA